MNEPDIFMQGDVTLNAIPDATDEQWAAVADWITTYRTDLADMILGDYRAMRA